MRIIVICFCPVMNLVKFFLFHGLFAFAFFLDSIQSTIFDFSLKIKFYSVVAILVNSDEAKTFYVSIAFQKILMPIPPSVQKEVLLVN